MARYRLAPQAESAIATRACLDSAHRRAEA